MARSPKRSALVPSPRKKLSRDDLSGHHPEVAAAIEPSLVKADRETDTLLSIGVALAAMRDDAVQARKNSGIEDIWRRCEEAYVGIDDANRAEFASMRWAKPMDSSGPVTTGTQNRSAYANKSNIFLRLTSRYVDAAYAKVAEIIVPPDDKAFSFTETPVPDLIEARNDRRIVRHEVTGEPLTRPLMPGRPRRDSRPRPWLHQRLRRDQHRVPRSPLPSLPRAPLQDRRHQHRWPPPPEGLPARRWAARRPRRSRGTPRPRTRGPRGSR